MILLALVLLLGVAAGYACGGRLRGLADLRLRVPGVLFAAVAVQVALVRVPSSWRPVLVLATYVAVGGWLIVNLAGRAPGLRAGFLAAGTGWCLNLAAMAGSGRMPVSAAALNAAGIGDLTVDRGHLSKHLEGGSGLLARALGDVIPLRPLHAVISAGDVALFAGIVVVVALAMTGPVANRWRSAA